MGDQNYLPPFNNSWFKNRGEPTLWFDDNGEGHDNEAERAAANVRIAERKWLIDTARAILWPEEVIAEQRARKFEGVIGLLELIPNLVFLYPGYPISDSDVNSAVEFVKELRKESESWTRNRKT